MEIICVCAQVAVHIWMKWTQRLLALAFLIFHRMHCVRFYHETEFLKLHPEAVPSAFLQRPLRKIFCFILLSEFIKLFFCKVKKKKKKMRKIYTNDDFYLQVPKLVMDHRNQILLFIKTLLYSGDIHECWNLCACYFNS